MQPLPPNRPGEFPDWATGLSDPVDIQEPDPARKVAGFDVPLMKPPRRWFNWLFGNLGEWVRWLDSAVTVIHAWLSTGIAYRGIYTRAEWDALNTPPAPGIYAIEGTPPPAGTGKYNYATIWSVPTGEDFTVGTWLDGGSDRLGPLRFESGSWVYPLGASINGTNAASAALMTGTNTVSVNALRAMVGFSSVSSAGTNAHNGGWRVMGAGNVGGVPHVIVEEWGTVTITILSGQTSGSEGLSLSPALSTLRPTIVHVTPLLSVQNISVQSNTAGGLITLDAWRLNADPAPLDVPVYWSAKGIVPAP